jgi:hypothetical protein
MVLEHQYRLQNVITRKMHYYLTRLTHIEILAHCRQMLCTMLRPMLRHLTTAKHNEQDKQ